MRGFASQASVAVINPPTGKTSLQFKVKLAGTFDKTGDVLSCTVMTCEAVAVLPQLSVAVHVRVKT